MPLLKPSSTTTTPSHLIWCGEVLVTLSSFLLPFPFNRFIFSLALSSLLVLGLLITWSCTCDSQAQAQSNRNPLRLFQTKKAPPTNGFFYSMRCFTLLRFTMLELCVPHDCRLYTMYIVRCRRYVAVITKNVHIYIMCIFVCMCERESISLCVYFSFCFAYNLILYLCSGEFMCVYMFFSLCLWACSFFLNFIVYNHTRFTVLSECNENKVTAFVSICYYF